MSKSKKLGRLTKDEQELIRKNYKTSTIEALAVEMGRRPEAINDYIINHLGAKPKITDKFKLTARKYWPSILKQISEEEAVLFEYHWEKIIEQFNRDVIHTEELQIIDVIRQEILCDRALRSQQDTANSLAELTEELRIAKVLSKDIDDPMESSENDQRIFDLDRQIAVMRAAQDTLSKDYKTYLSLKMQLFDKIKGSRHMRISKIEDMKETFSTLALKLRTDPNFAEKVSLDMEKMRLSMKMHLQTLGDYHEFENTTDRPFLNAETVFFEGTEEDEGKD